MSWFSGIFSSSASAIVDSVGFRLFKRTSNDGKNKKISQ